MNAKANTYQSNREERRPDMNTKTYHRISTAQNALTEPQLLFLNSRACRYANPHSQNFWPELTAMLEKLSRQVAALPRARDYRLALEPYLLRRVHMVTDTWDFQGTGKGCARLLLHNVRLKHVYGNTVGTMPDITVSCMNIWVSTDWLNRVAPAYDEKLTLSGVLYQCADQDTDGRRTRNICLLPVLVRPLSRKLSSWTPCAIQTNLTPDSVA